LQRAIAWSQEQMKRDGLSNVQLIPVKVPNWKRGAESARLLAPENRPLHMLGIGMSAGTPPTESQADVVVVSDFDELANSAAPEFKERSCSTTNPIVDTVRPSRTALPARRERRSWARSPCWCGPSRLWRCRFRTPAL